MAGIGFSVILPFVMYRAIIIFWIAVLGTPSAALALESSELPLVEPFGIRARLLGGPAVLAREVTFAGEFSFELGIAEGVVLAAPLALGVRILDVAPGSGIYLGLGIIDLYVAEDGELIYEPAIAFSGQARLGPESAFRASLDFAGVEKGFSGGDHPFWLRGSVAVIVDLGPWLTFAAGIAYQRQIVDGAAPENGVVTDWLGGSRFSIGSVRSQPFAELPTLSVHVLPFLDIIGLISFDVDTNTRTSNAWWLVGVELKTRGRENGPVVD